MTKLYTVAALSLVLAPLAQACPDLNGRFVTAKTGENNSYKMIELKSKVEGGGHHYSLDGGENYFLADGIERAVSGNGQNGTIQGTCNGETLTVVAKIEGLSTPILLTYQKLNENQIHAVVVGPESEDELYTRE